MSDSKFLFDRNNFDETDNSSEDNAELEDQLENLEPAPPPPPTFTGADMERATQSGIEQGKREAEEQMKNDETVRANGLIGQIKAQIDALIFNENERQNAFEQNTIALVMAIHEKTFPALSQKFGPDQLKQQITDALTKQSQKKSITVTISDTLYEQIKTHFETQNITHVTFEKDETFDELQCLVTWSDGGIIVNTTQMAEKTQSILNDLLEEPQKNDHDEN